VLKHKASVQFCLRFFERKRNFDPKPNCAGNAPFYVYEKPVFQAHRNIEGTVRVAATIRKVKKEDYEKRSQRKAFHNPVEPCLGTTEWVPCRDETGKGESKAFPDTT